MSRDTKRYLILNADDYGMSQSTNEAVEELFEVGWITSTTLMTPCPWAEDGVRRAKQNPKMHVGLHTTLNSEWDGYRWGPVSHEPVPSLLDASGYLPRSVQELVERADPAHVLVELQAQMRYMDERGLPPTHVDNHMGSVYGLFGPHYLAQIFALCAPRKLPFRMPRSLEGFGPAPAHLAGMVGELIAQADALGIGLLERLLDFGRRLTASDTYETVRARYIEVAIQGCVPGVNELYMHPALECEELKSACPAWQMRVWEHRVLKDPIFRDAIDEAGIVRTTWIDAPFTKGA